MGDNVSETNQTETVIKKKKKIGPAVIAIIIVGVIVLVAAAIVTSVGVFGKKARINRKLNSATNYISQLNYENAMADYDEIIGIDPACLDAYIGKANVYVAMDDYDSAIETLSAGYEETDSANFELYDNSVKETLCDMVVESRSNEDFDKAIKKIFELDEEYSFTKEQLEEFARVAIGTEHGVNSLISKFNVDDLAVIDEDLFIELTYNILQKAGKGSQSNFLVKLVEIYNTPEKMEILYDKLQKYYPEASIADTRFDEGKAKDKLNINPEAVKVFFYHGEYIAINSDGKTIKNCSIVK